MRGYVAAQLLPKPGSHMPHFLLLLLSQSQLGAAAVAIKQKDEEIAKVKRKLEVHDGANKRSNRAQKKVRLLHLTLTSWHTTELLTIPFAGIQGGSQAAAGGAKEGGGVAGRA